MTKTKFFPVILWNDELRNYPGIPRFIPWAAIAPFEDQAKLNHCGQNLECLAKRGGLSPFEIYCVMHRKKFREAWDVSEITAAEFLKSIETSNRT